MNMLKLTVASTIISLLLAGGCLLYGIWKRQKKAGKIKRYMAQVRDLLGDDTNTRSIGTENREKTTTRHHLEMAKWLLDHIRSLDPANALALHYTGMYYLRLGNLIDAEKLCRQACDIDPDNSLTRNGLGLVFQQKGQPDRT